MFANLWSSIRRWYRQGMQPIAWLYERIGIVQPRAVATRDYPVNWVDDDTKATTSETFTIILLQYPSGKRAYEVVSFGYCETYKYHKRHLRDVVIWTYGGPLPSGFRRQDAAPEIIPFKTISLHRDE